MSRERKGERMFGFEGPSVAFVSGSFLALDRDLNVFFQIHSTSLEIHMFFLYTSYVSRPENIIVAYIHVFARG